ncbi:MAG: lysophospholipid acyltransferase family protein [Gammaproteobacteria bacterium]
MKIIFIRIFLFIGAVLPLPVSHGLGYLAGWGLFLFPSHSRRITQVNLALCLPELGAAEQRKLVRKSLIETGKTIFEAGALWLRRGESTLRLVKIAQGSDLVDAALADGKGVILATPHQGAWEAAGLYCAAHYNITCLYRPLKMQQLDALVTTARGRLGGHYVPANASGIRTLRKKLKQGDAVAMLPDQEPLAGGGVFAPFFGVPAYSMVLPGRLAEKSGAPLIFVWCERLSWGRGYHLHFRKVPGGAYSKDPVEAAATVNQVVEDCARTSLAQYQWSYRRFRRRPGGEQEFY